MGQCLSKHVAADGDGDGEVPPSAPPPSERAVEKRGGGGGGEGVAVTAVAAAALQEAAAPAAADAASPPAAAAAPLPRSAETADAARRKARDGAKRIAVAANALARGADVKVQAYPKAEPVMALLAAAVARSPLFAPLSSPERATLLHSMTPVTCSAGQVVIREGDAVADKFFVLEKGAAVATVLVKDSSDDKENGKSGGVGGGENGDKGEEERPKKEKQVREYGPGASFGELALLYSSPRAATVTATAPSKLWVLDAAVYAAVRRAAAAAAAARRAALVRSVPLLQPLSDATRAVVADALERVEFADGARVFAQGETGDALYLVDEGAVKMVVSVEVDGKKKEEKKEEAEVATTNNNGSNGNGKVVATVAAGGHFGERALVRSEPRSASAVADGYAVLYRLPAAAFFALLGPLEAVWAAEALRRAPALSALSGAQLAAVAAAMGRVEVKKNGVVFAAGDPGDAFYVIDEGEAVVTVEVKAKETKEGEKARGQEGGGEGEGGQKTGEVEESTKKEVARLGKGAVFGELALIAKGPRAATVTAATDCSLLRLSASDFEAMLGSLASLRTIWRAEALRRVALLAPLSSAERGALAAALRPRAVEAGADVVVAGEPGEEFFLVESGELDVLAASPTTKATKAAAGSSSSSSSSSSAAAAAAASAAGEENREPVIVGRIGAGGYFGELSLLRGEPRAATVRAATRCELLALPRADFEALLGPAKALLAAGASSYGRAGGGAPRLSDLRRVAKLGSGAFGKVSLVTTAAAAAAAAAAKAKNNNKENNNASSSSSSSSPPLPFYALKTLSKAALVDAGLVEHVRRERATMAECDSAFVVRLVAAYQESSKLHLLQEAVPGGELFGLLADRADAGLGPLSEPEARFYAGCVVLGIEYLHSRDLAWRDLKPENLLVAADGYLKLADLGFARRLARGERASTLCGTPEYLAPELVAQAGHTRAVDWWALGVLVFEMAAGRPPFDGNGGSGSGSGGGGDRMAMFRDISKGKFSFPAHFSKELRDLVKKLLTVSAAARLGSGREGAAEVKAHPWFSGPVGSVAPASAPAGSPNAAALPRFDWDALAARSIPAPFLPPTSTTARWAESVERGGGSLPGVGENDAAAAAGEDEDGEEEEEEEEEAEEEEEEEGGSGGGGGSRERYESTGAFRDF